MPRSKLSGSELQFFDIVDGSESTFTKLKSTTQNTLSLEGNTNTDRVRVTNVAQPTQPSDVTTQDYVETRLLTVVNELVVTEDQIQDGAVTESKIADGSVTTAKIADASVTTAKITDANVTTAKIADASVTTAKITDANVTTAKIADASVTTAKIADASVTTAKINDANVTTTKIADANVTTAKIADASVTTVKIADASVTTDKIGSLTSLTVDGPITATSFITDGDGGGSVSGGSSSSSTVVFHPILLMAKTQPQTLSNHLTTAISFDSVTHQSTDNVITYDSVNTNFVLAEVGVYEVSFSVIFEGDTVSASRTVHFECSDSPTKHYAFHSDHQSAGGHGNIRFTTIDFVKVSTANATLTVYAYQSNADGGISRFLSGGYSENLHTRICIRRIA